MTRPVLAVIGAALLLTGAAIGRFSAPAHIQERIVYREREQERIEWQWKGEEARKTDVVTRTVIKTRWVPSPAGPVIERTEETASDTHEATTATVAEARVEVRERVVYRDRETSTSREASSWRLAASASTGLALTPVYGAEIGRRLLGPVWIGVRGQTDRTLAVVAGLEW